MKKTPVSVASCGVDVHRQFSTVTFRDERTRVVHRGRLEHRDRAALREQLAAWPAEMPVVLEASFGWGWLSDLMEEAGLEVHLSNCWKVEQMRRVRGEAKTNRKDADLLALLPFEPQRWWEVWRAPREVRDLRERLRYRADLVAGQTRLKNQIHALFHRHGIFHEYSDLFGVKGRAFLVGLCRDGCPELPAGALTVLRGQVQLLDQIRKQLADIARSLKARLGRDALIGYLMTLPGIGLILAHVLAAEIGDLRRFASHRALASYSLLAPIADESGEIHPGEAPQGRHLGVRGSRVLKWAFIEAAHGAVRKDPYCRELFDRHTDGGKKNRNRGYIKVARHLVKLTYAIWRDGRPYRPEPPAANRPTARTAAGPQTISKRKTRSGTGRLVRPMVVAR